MRHPDQASIVKAGTYRTGRIVLWLVFFPLGMWRSIRHGRKETELILLEEIRQSEQRILTEIRSVTRSDTSRQPALHSRTTQ